MNWLTRLRETLNRLFGSSSSPRPSSLRSTRVSGYPTSSNKASSFHARWLGGPRHVVAVEVDLTITATPQSDDLRFFALQASFADRTTSYGAGHLGLQWISWHPGMTAVNWGGYYSPGSGQAGELPGTVATLPSAVNNVNSRDFAWSAGIAYRLSIERGIEGWAGIVTDLSTGNRTVVRDLISRGDRLTSVVMWSEIFAPCEGPEVEVRWSEPRWIDVDGVSHPVPQVQLSYQSVADGGCSNTSTVVEGSAVVQRSATPRTNAQDSVLHLG